MTSTGVEQTDNYDDEIDLRELFRVIWSSRWWIVGTTAVAALIAVVVVLMLPNVYRAEALLAPNPADGTTGLSALAAQYGGLASLAGINLGPGKVDDTVIGLEILKSRKFISEFIEHHQLLVPLMASSGWDPETGELQIDSDIYDLSESKWVRDVRPPRTQIPSKIEANEKFREDVLSVTQNEKTSLVTIAIEHHSPLMAKQWVDWLVEDINAVIMQQDVEQAQQAIEYLNEQVQLTSLAELQTVFFRLIEEQIKIVMLASVTSEYLLKTIDPAVVPEEKSSPYRALLVLLGSVLGGLVGLAVALIRGKNRA